MGFGVLDTRAWAWRLIKPQHVALRHSEGLSYPASDQMGSAKVVLPIADGDSAVINTWLVREGDVVTEGKTILRFTCLGRCEPLIVESVGRIGKVLLAQGSTVGAGEPVCTLHPCPHEECFNGICTACGVEVKEDRSSFSFFGGVASNVLRRSQEGVVSQQQQRVQELLGAKKLALVLDLDHTLAEVGSLGRTKGRYKPR